MISEVTMMGNIPWYDALQLLAAAGVICYAVAQVIYNKLHGIDDRYKASKAGRR